MNRIAALRKEASMSQAELAERLKIHQTAVSQWEKGRTSPSFDAIMEMCSIFDVRADYLLGRSDERGHFTLTPQEQDELGEMAIADYDREHLQRYKRLDAYGKAAVDAVTQAELDRMKEQQAEG